MTLIILSYLAGVLTIISPCILPVLPFVFASAGGPFHRNADGNGTVKEQRLYQLIRQPNAVADHTFEIEFLDPGVQAHSFTFG